MSLVPIRSINPVLSIGTIDPLVQAREKIKACRLEVAKHPSYGSALALQQAKKELNKIAAERRKKRLKLVFDYENEILNKVA